MKSSRVPSDFDSSISVVSINCFSLPFFDESILLASRDTDSRLFKEDSFISFRETTSMLSSRSIAKGTFSKVSGEKI